MKYDYFTTEIQELILARNILTLTGLHHDAQTAEITSDICFSMFLLMDEDNKRSTVVDWHELYSLLDQLWMSTKNNDQDQELKITVLERMCSEIQSKIDSINRGQSTG